jgi:hypothetical protein
MDGMNKIELKRISFTPESMSAGDLSLYCSRIDVEAKKTEGCDGVYYSLDFDDPYDERAYTHNWVFYRLETAEEWTLRKKKAEQSQLNYKLNQYEKLKKELGL